ncbi:MAG: hypothetical protein KAY24_09220 [Candidatus Eisenbacteria sp.]|nr:hypothetical protein [Candidatus Eisenbacteria bacterium]
MAEDPKDKRAQASGEAPASTSGPSLRVSPILLGVGLLASISLVLSLGGTLKANNYRKQFDVVLQAAKDPAKMTHFQEANTRLMASNAYEPGTLAVIYGADLGHYWHLSDSLQDDGIVNRSLPDQDMTKLMLRFEQDVLSLEPEIVVLLPPVRCVSKGRLMIVQARALCTTAQAYGLQPILARIPPVPAALDTLAGGYYGRILAINRGIDELAANLNIPILDLFTPLTGANYYLFSEYCGPNIWPNARGYQTMTEELHALMDALPTPVPSEGLKKAEDTMRMAEP